MSQRGPHLPFALASSRRQPPLHSKSSVHVSPPAFRTVHFARIHERPASHSPPGHASPSLPGSLPADALLVADLRAETLETALAVGRDLTIAIGFDGRRALVADAAVLALGMLAIEIARLPQETGEGVDGAAAQVAVVLHGPALALGGGTRAEATEPAGALERGTAHRAAGEEPVHDAHALLGRRRRKGTDPIAAFERLLVGRLALLHFAFGELHRRRLDGGGEGRAADRRHHDARVRLAASRALLLRHLAEHLAEPRCERVDRRLRLELVDRLDVVGVVASIDARGRRIHFRVDRCVGLGAVVVRLRAAEEEQHRKAQERRDPSSLHAVSSARTRAVSKSSIRLRRVSARVTSRARRSSEGPIARSRPPRRSQRSSQGSAAKGATRIAIVCRDRHRDGYAPEGDRDQEPGPQREDDEADAELVGRSGVGVFADLLRHRAGQLVRKPVERHADPGERNEEDRQRGAGRAREIEARFAIGSDVTGEAGDHRVFDLGVLERLEVRRHAELDGADHLGVDLREEPSCLFDTPPESVQIGQGLRLPWAIPDGGVLVVREHFGHAHEGDALVPGRALDEELREIGPDLLGRGFPEVAAHERIERADRPVEDQRARAKRVPRFELEGDGLEGEPTHVEGRLLEHASGAGSEGDELRLVVARPFGEDEDVATRQMRSDALEDGVVVHVRLVRVVPPAHDRHRLGRVEEPLETGDLPERALRDGRAKARALCDHEDRIDEPVHVIRREESPRRPRRWHLARHLDLAKIDRDDLSEETAEDAFHHARPVYGTSRGSAQRIGGLSRLSG